MSLDDDDGTSSPSSRRVGRAGARRQAGRHTTRRILHRDREAEQALQYRGHFAYPRRFSSVMHARAWLQRFFDLYAEHHHHTGLVLFTPGDVFHGRVETIAVVRQAALDAGYAAHPERFPNGPPVVALPPMRVAINPIATPSSSRTSCPISRSSLHRIR